MYLKRQIDNDLIKWSKEANRHPILLRGARQVGKFSSVRKLAKRTIFLFMICCIASLRVTGQYNPGFTAGSAAIDSTKQPTSIIFKSFTFPSQKGLNYGKGINYNLWQPGKEKHNPFGYTLSQDYYRFKSLEIGVTYQHNMSNMIKTNYITSDIMRGWKLVHTSPFIFR